MTFERLSESVFDEIEITISRVFLVKKRVRISIVLGSVFEHFFDQVSSLFFCLKSRRIWGVRNRKVTHFLATFRQGGEQIWEVSRVVAKCKK